MPISFLQRIYDRVMALSTPNQEHIIWKPERPYFMIEQLLKTVADSLSVIKWHLMKNDIIQIEGNGKLVDSSNNVIVLGDQMIIDKKNSTFLATRKPVMIIFKNNDSTFITADTLYSGKRKNQVDSSVSITKTDAVKNSDSVKYFMGFHHVRIYNDSIQAVADSLHYSTIDSTFKLFKNPVCWNGNTQLSGDTIFLFTTNQQPKRVFIWNNAMVINKTSAGFYNQMTGRNMNAYFNDGTLDYIRTKGSPAESIFYPTG